MSGLERKWWTRRRSEWVRVDVALGVSLDAAIAAQDAKRKFELTDASLIVELVDDIQAARNRVHETS